MSKNSLLLVAKEVGKNVRKWTKKGSNVRIVMELKYLVNSRK